MTGTEIVMALIIAVLGSSTIATIVNALITRHYAELDKASEKSEKEDERLETIEFVLGALAHDSYFDDCRKLINKDAITEEELDNHNYLYRAYHELGLNSTGDRLHELILEKPVITQY